MAANNGKRILEFVFVAILLLLAGYYCYTLDSANAKLQDQVTERDNFIEQTRVRDSVLAEQRKKNKDVVEQYISGCDILIDGKKITTEELVRFLNDQMGEIAELERRIYQFEDTLLKLRGQLSNIANTGRSVQERMIGYADSLSLYKSFYELAKKNLNVDFSVKGTDSNRIVTIIIPRNKLLDSATIYRKLYQLAQKDYGIKYTVTTKGDVTYYQPVETSADTALVLLEYYRRRIKKDENGDWIIKVPGLWKKNK